MLAFAGMTGVEVFSVVTLNLFQGPLRGLAASSRWMLKQVQHDDGGDEGGPLPAAAPASAGATDLDARLPWLTDEAL